MLPAPVRVCQNPYILGGVEDKAPKWGLHTAETFLLKNVRKTDIFFLLILCFVWGCHTLERTASVPCPGLSLCCVGKSPPTKDFNACLYVLLLAAALFALCGLPWDVTGLWGEGRWGSKGSECKHRASPALCSSLPFCHGPLMLNYWAFESRNAFHHKEHFKEESKESGYSRHCLWMTYGESCWEETTQTSPCAFSFAKIQLLSYFSHHKIVSLSFPGGCITGAGM